MAALALVRRAFGRAGRRVNVALLLLLVGALLTGAMLFAAAAPPWATAARIGHGLAGVGLVVLLPWKTGIILRASRIRPASVVLSALVLTCLASGFLEVFWGYGLVAGVSPIQVHVGSALAGLLFAVLHVVRHRPVALRRSDLSRRRLLTTGGFALGVGVAYGGSEVLGRVTGSAAGRRTTTGSHRLPSSAIPATSWLLDRVPDVHRAIHRVDVAGAGLGVADLEALARPVTARLDCTSGWYADATWTAVPLSALLEVDALRDAASIEVGSLTGYVRRFPAGQADHLWLATRLEGRPLRPGHGAPVRLVAPGRRGFWWVKWVSSVQLSEVPAALQAPFPTQ